MGSSGRRGRAGGPRRPARRTAGEGGAARGRAGRAAPAAPREAPAAVEPGRLVVRPELRRPALRLGDEPPAALAPAQGARLEAILAAPPRRRLDALVDAPDARDLVPAIPPDVFTATVLEVGKGDCDVLLGHASDEQLVHLVDLTAWPDETLDVAATVESLEVLRAAGPEVCLRWLRSADDSAVVALLSKLALVTTEDVPLPGALDEGEFGAPFSPDGAFVVWPRDTAFEGFLRWLLTELFEHHQETYFWALQSVQWMLPSEAEEDARVRRAGRLVEAGFAPPEQAAEVFAPAPAAWLEPVAVARTVRRAGPSPDLRGGEIVAAPPDLPSDAPFLAACAARLAAAEAREVREAIDRLSRLVLAAELLDPGNPDHRRAARRRAARTLSIALEHLAGGDPATGAAVLLERRAADLFRVGQTLVARLYRRALALRRDGWLGRVRGATGLLEPDLLREYEACRHPRPQRFAGLDEEGGPRYEPYATLAEVDASRRALETIAALGRLLVDGLGMPDDPAQAIDLSACLPASWSEVTAGDVLRTALVHGVARGSVRFEPVTGDDLARFVKGAVEGGRLRASFRTGAPAALLARVPGAERDTRAALAAYLAQVVDRLDEELAGLDPEPPIDPRFVGGVVRRVAG